MQQILFHSLILFLCLVPRVSTAQGLLQLMSAKTYHEMKSGSEKIEKIRNLERWGWYHHDTYYDLKGKPMESPKIDLAPYVDELGETVFLVTDIAPEFPAGKSAFDDYLQNALGDLLIQPGESVQNSVRIKYSVEKDGRVVNVETEQVAEWVSKEVVRRCKTVLQEMPNWSPGIYKDRPVKVKMLMDFSLRE